MNLLNLPEEVIEGYILPLLKWNDLLRFRRVCKTTRDITTAYMRVHPALAPELEVNLEEKSFKAFLEMDIPTTKLFLKNNESGDKFFDDDETKWNILLFLLKYGHLVKYLRMSKFSSQTYLYLCGTELDFVFALKNLEDFETTIFSNVEGDVDQMADQTTVGQKAIVQNGNLCWRSVAYLVACQKIQLEYLPLKYEARTTPETVSWLRDPNNCMALAFLSFHNSIQMSLQRCQKVSFKSIDFLGYHDVPKEKQELLESRAGFRFLQLCVTCLENGVKMKNVGAKWFSERESPRSPPGANARELGNVVVSMVNVQSGVFSLEMNNLERIYIRATSQCDTRLGPGQSLPVWPRLKVLGICVDGNVGSLELFGFFFKNVCRAELVELELKFQEEKEHLAVPETQDIVNACPNLKKLKIVNWPGTNTELVKLWNGLEGLEEVSLENCKQLEDVGFVGVDLENPAFLKLKNLKKLSLKKLDQMPKITDALFSQVIYHLKLIQFFITSNAPIKSVTLAGIESLLNGQFAKSIEKFPFGQWSLEGVSMEQLDELNQKFRSSKML